MAGNQRVPFKVTVVGGGHRGSKVWRRERIDMTDPELDDVAFLSGLCALVIVARTGSWAQRKHKYNIVIFIEIIKVFRTME